MASSSSSFFDTDIQIGTSNVRISNKLIGKLDPSDDAVKVYKGSCDGEAVAIKVWPTSNEARIEYDFLNACSSSPYVVKTFGYKCDLTYQGARSFLIMELMDTSLCALLEQENLPELSLLYIAQSIAQGLQDIHTQNIIHRDIKPENILLKFVGEGAVTKIADLGSATFTKNVESAVAGTVAFVAPEMFKGELVKSSADIYSYGMTVFTMCYHYNTIERNQNLSNAIAKFENFYLMHINDDKDILTNEEYKTIVKAIIDNREFSTLRAASESKVEYSSEFIDLIKQCMHPDPSARCSIDTILLRLKDMIRQQECKETVNESDSSSTSASTIGQDSIDMISTEDDNDDDLPDFLKKDAPIPKMPDAPRGYTVASAESTPLQSFSLYSSSSSSDRGLTTNQPSPPVPAKR